MIDKLTQIIRNSTGDNSIVIDENTVLLADLGMNSLELVSLVCEIEDEFDIEIPDRAIKGFKTVGDVVRFIDAQ